MERVPWKRGSCYLVQVYYCHLGTGYYVISLFGFSKKARNSDFYVSSPKFFQGWLKLMLFCDFTREYGIFFFQETLTSVLSWLTHLVGTRSPHAGANTEGERGWGRGRAGETSAQGKDNKYWCFIFYQNVYIPPNWVLRMSKTCMIARNL